MRYCEDETVLWCKLGFHSAFALGEPTGFPVSRPVSSSHDPALTWLLSSLYWVTLRIIASLVVPSRRTRAILRLLRPSRLRWMLPPRWTIMITPTMSQLCSLLAD